MTTDELCSTCKEEASLKCKLCNCWYCWDHLCTHLQSAHSNNSYTNRLQIDIDEGARENYENSTSGTFKINNNTCEQVYVNERTGVLPHNAKPPSTYTTSELEQQLNFHRFEARRIRNELERRALFASGVVPRTFDFSVYDYDNIPRLQRLSRRNTRSSNSALPKSITRAIEILALQLRYGTISVEQIKAQITSNQRDRDDSSD